MSVDARRHAGVWPDAGGHFGPYGGRYVPETLMEPLAELEEAYEGRAPRSRLRVRAARAPPRLRGPAHAPRPRGAALGAARRPRLAEARGPLPHGRAQDQQRPRPGAPREADGEEARHRRDRRGAARRRDGHGRARSSAWSASSTWAPRTCARQAPERLADAAPRRRGRAVSSGSRTLKDAINEAMRDWVTNVRDDALPPRLGPRRASLPGDGARLPGGHRPRGPRTDARGGRSACPTCSSPASAAARTRSASSIAFLDDAGVRMVGVEAGGAALDARASTPRGSAEHGSARRGRAARDADLPAAGRGRAGAADALGLGGPGLPGGRPRARAAARRGRVEYASVTDGEALAAFHLLGETEGIMPALETAHAVAWVVREAAARRAGR